MIKINGVEPKTVIHAGSRQGALTISTTPVLIQVGASPLEGRHTVLIHNDASVVLYVGFNSNVTSSDGWQLSSGTALEFKFDPAEHVDVFVVFEEGTTSINVMELR